MYTAYMSEIPPAPPSATTTIALPGTLRDQLKSLSYDVAAYYNVPTHTRLTMSETVSYRIDAFRELEAGRPPRADSMRGSKAYHVVKLLGTDWTFEPAHGLTCFLYKGYPMWVNDQVLADNDARTVALMLGPCHGVGLVRGTTTN